MGGFSGVYGLARGALIGLLVLLLLAAGAAQAAIPAAERQALLDLYASTNGAGWTTSTNWKGAAGTECTWSGVFCYPPRTNVTGLNLASNHLAGPLPATINDLASLTNLNLDHNQLTGPIPSFAANTVLQELWLGSNQLSGPIPSFAANTALQVLLLSSNQLTGPVDASLGTLANLLAGGGLDLRWNALSSTDATLITFLNSKQDGGDWQSTQTIPVTGLSVSGITGTQATVNWTPITYTADSGSYQVFTSTLSGGPYTPFATVTVNKSATSLTVTGLTPGTPYFFTVQTTTAPHALNQNTVLSGYSAEVPSATTPVDPDAPASIPAASPTALLAFASLLAGLGALRISRGSQ